MNSGHADKYDWIKNTPAANARAHQPTVLLVLGVILQSQAGWARQLETIVLDICSMDEVKEPHAALSHSLSTTIKRPVGLPEFYCLVKIIGSLDQQL